MLLFCQIEGSYIVVLIYNTYNEWHLNVHWIAKYVLIFFTVSLKCIDFDILIYIKKIKYIKSRVLKKMIDGKKKLTNKGFRLSSWVLL